MLAQRLVSRITRSRSSASSLPSVAFLRIRLVKVNTPVSGLFSSCAMPAASCPMEANFSPRATSASASLSSSVRSFTFSLSVSTHPSSSCLDFFRAPIMALDERARLPNSSSPRTGMGLSKLPDASRLAPFSRSRSG